MPRRRIYLLSPKEIDPETIAVAFAKTSRSPKSFHEIVAELSQENSAQFHEKWVVGYGHASVAEHAILHIAIENVSRLAVENIESNRLASYTEKSTRYQQWASDHFHVPYELKNHSLEISFIDTCRRLFDAYLKSMQLVKAQVEKENPRCADESDRAFDNRIRSQYVDVCRFLLPAASLANLGMTVNARALESALTKLLSHPLKEVNQIGEEIKREALHATPTLVKYAQRLPYLNQAAQGLADLELTSSNSGQENADWCSLIHHDPDGEIKVLAAAVYRFHRLPYHQAMEFISSASRSKQEEIAKMLLEGCDVHTPPLRELEHTCYMFDLLLDQGAYAEFKRHRMMTQTPQLLTCELGYALPRRIVEAGYEKAYKQAMTLAAETYAKLNKAFGPLAAQYVVPNGYNRRVLFSMNLREAFHFCQLRSAPNAHFSIRRVAQRVAEEIRRVHPLLGKYLNISQAETWQGIENQYLFPSHSPNSEP